MSTWYLTVLGQQQGPLEAAAVVARIRAGEIPADAWVFGPGMASWEPIRSRAEFAQAFAPGGAPALRAPPPPPQPGGRAHDIDYELFGEELQYVEITLDPQEACVAEAGSFFYMDQGIELQTIFGDGSGQGGGLLDKLFSAGRRVLTGESLFMTLFANTGGAGRRRVAFAAPYPGKIVPMHLGKLGGTMICQKDAFLCAAKGISVGIAFQRKLGAGFFGGEGFILQKLEGDGYAFVHACGAVLERELGPGETLRVDTGCLVAFEPRVTYDIQLVKGVKTALFGGEGLFFATLTGPGRVWLQSLPFSRFASRVFSAAGGAGRGKEEGSVLGGLGRMLSGD
ncbi:MAG: TIGR00266 family protein [Anaeromyxobacter sp.]|nr:TIGR00266 family protein [Anaeromyxobacter sp.]MBL0277388.1 TIGR00266 family protein [Anaeromyxobacter sp.]